METCYGCGAQSDKVTDFARGGTHPVVGIINKADLETDTVFMPNPKEDSAFVGVPICKKCHEEPEHRTAHALKCHFVMRDDSRKVLVGLVMAGSNSLQL